jgi:hypothetical protein
MCMLVCGPENRKIRKKAENLAEQFWLQGTGLFQKYLLISQFAMHLYPRWIRRYRNQVALMH